VLAAANVCNVEVVVGDAMQPRATRADAVLLDAPCSGLGILGRQPEARWRKSADDPSRLAEQQRTMLAAAIESLRPSGRLVYSVCTTDRRECEGVVDAVVDGVRLRRSREDVVVTPGVGRRDGFYVATLQSSP
jgi:16S rRNA (cytosine967-C5)-methyltransferase